MLISVDTPAKARARGVFRQYGEDFAWMAALALVVLVLLHESLFMGKGLVAADAVLHMPPWNLPVYSSNALLSDQYCIFQPLAEFVHHQKTFPLWNPYLCCGVPNLGGIQGALLFPIRLLLSPLDPFTASGISAFIKLCLAGWFTMFYLRLLGASRPGAFLAGMTFSLSGFMIVWLGHPHVNTAMWLPLLLYFMEKGFRDGQGGAFTAPAMRPWAGFAVAYGFMLLGGHPPTAIHVTMVLVAYFIFRSITSNHAQIPGWIALLAVSSIVGVFLAAPQILPFLEYYHYSSSAASSAVLDRAASHLPIQAVIHFLLPNVLGNPSLGFELINPLRWRESTNFNERTGYVGILPLFLAVWAMASRPGKTACFFFGMAALCLLVIFGVPPIPTLLHLLPGADSVNEMRLLLVVGFSGAVLAGLGWDEFFRMTSKNSRVYCVTIGFFVVSGVICFWFWGTVHARAIMLEPRLVAFLKEQFLVLAGGLTAVLVLVLWPARWDRRIPMAVGLLWTAGDLLCFAMDYNPAINRDLYYPATPAIEWLQKQGPTARIFGSGSILPVNTAEIFGICDARGCDFMSVRRYEELITGKVGNFYFYGYPTAFPKTFELLNAKYVMTKPGAPADPALFDLVYQNEICIYRFKYGLNRAFPVFDYQVESDPAKVLADVFSPQFDPHKTALLEEEPPGSLPSGPSATATGNTASVSINSYEADSVEVRASMPQPGFLVLLDTYFPGWTATVNGQDAPVLRADYNFRAVRLPAGDSDVTFSYRPPSFEIGLCLCAIATAAIGAVLLAPLFKAAPRR